MSGQTLDAKALTAAFARLGLTPSQHQRVRTLSHGTQKRLALARVMLRPAPLLLLDEPYSGFAALVLAPPDAVQGNVQRIMYVHVPAAWVGFLAFFVVFVGSVMYLMRGTPGWDHLAAASAEIGVLFTAQAIVAGAIWGKPTWGTWWTWDPRLTTTAILLLIYAGYLLLRSMASDARRGARQAAVLGIVGFVDMPITYMSVLWWRTLHQGPSIFRSSGPTMATSMLLILLLNVLAFTVLYGYLLVRRLDVQRLELQALAIARGG